jgi:hypothetical protein
MPQLHGEVIFVRFADDFVASFQHRYETEQFLAKLRMLAAILKTEPHLDDPLFAWCKRLQHRRCLLSYFVTR